MISKPKKVEFGIYLKESLPVQIINQHCLKETLLTELNYNNKKMIASVIYHSQSQSTDEFDSFLILKIFWMT